MKSLAAQGSTVFLSSHLMSEMAQTADHLLVIGRGRIIANAGTDELVNRSAAGRVRVRAVQQTDLADALTRRGALIECGPNKLPARHRPGLRGHRRSRCRLWHHPPGAGGARRVPFGATFYSN